MVNKNEGIGILFHPEPEPGTPAGTETLSLLCSGSSQKFWLLAAPTPAPKHWLYL